VDQHYAATADATHLGIHHALDEGAGHSGVDSIAAPPHHLEADLGSLGLWSDDDGHEERMKENPDGFPSCALSGISIGFY
jgi:hypothetical protein